MCCFSAAHFSEQTQRKATLHRESQTSCSRLGAVLATSSKLMKAKVFFFFMSLGLSVCIFYGKKAAKRVSKLLNIVLNRARVCEAQEPMAEGGWYWGGSSQINQRMGNTWNFLWECRQSLSTQNELYEVRWASGDFSIVNRSRMVSFSWADNKKCKRIIIVIKN